MHVFICCHLQDYIWQFANICSTFNIWTFSSTLSIYGNIHANSATIILNHLALNCISAFIHVRYIAKQNKKYLL